MRPELGVMLIIAPSGFSPTVILFHLMPQPLEGPFRALQKVIAFLIEFFSTVIC